MTTSAYSKNKRFNWGKELPESVNTGFRAALTARLLVFSLIISISFAVNPASSINAHQKDQGHTARRADSDPSSRYVTPEQKKALEGYGQNVTFELDDRGVPASLTGLISKRRYKDDPVAEAQAALETHAAAFRRRPDDGFTLIRIEKDRQGLTQVRMAQTYKGIPVIDGELIVHLNKKAVIGISGRFIADLNLSTEPEITVDMASSSALSQLESEGVANPSIVEVRMPIVFIDNERQGRLAMPVHVEHGAEGREEEELLVDANKGLVLGRRMMASQTVRPLISFNALRNPGFELGDNGNWSRSPDSIVNYGIPHNGSWCAWLCGYGSTHTDWVTQFISVPFNVTSASLSFWVRIDTAETTTTVAFDRLRVLIRNNSGVELATVATYSNLSKTNGYIFQSFSLNLWPYRGQTIQIPYFLATEDSSLATSFYIDDVALLINSQEPF